MRAVGIGKGFGGRGDVSREQRAEGENDGGRRAFYGWTSRPIPCPSVAQKS